MTTATVGQIISFVPAKRTHHDRFDSNAVYAAIVARVNADGSLNLAVFDGNGAALSLTGVGFISGSDTVPKDGFYAAALGFVPPVVQPTLAPTLSASTPQGTLATPNTATLGATTNQVNGTLYGVVDTAANLASVTAGQIVAGENATGAVALVASSSAVKTSTPSLGISGLVAGVLYSFALVQTNASGTSNVVSGTFTTAVASASAMSPLPSPLTAAPKPLSPSVS